MPKIAITPDTPARIYTSHRGFQKRQRTDLLIQIGAPPIEINYTGDQPHDDRRVFEYRTRAIVHDLEFSRLEALARDLSQIIGDRYTTCSSGLTLREPHVYDCYFDQKEVEATYTRFRVLQGFLQERGLTPEEKAVIPLCKDARQPRQRLVLPAGMMQL